MTGQTGALAFKDRFTVLRIPRLDRTEIETIHVAQICDEPVDFGGVELETRHRGPRHARADDGFGAANGRGTPKLPTTEVHATDRIPGRAMTGYTLATVEAGAKRNVRRRILDRLIERRILLRDDHAASPHDSQDKLKSRPFPDCGSLHDATYIL